MGPDHPRCALRQRNQLPQQQVQGSTTSNMHRSQHSSSQQVDCRIWTYCKQRKETITTNHHHGPQHAARTNLLPRPQMLLRPMRAHESRPLSTRREPGSNPKEAEGAIHNAQGAYLLTTPTTTTLESSPLTREHSHQRESERHHLQPHCPVATEEVITGTRLRNDSERPHDHVTSFSKAEQC